MMFQLAYAIHTRIRRNTIRWMDRCSPILLVQSSLVMSLTPFLFVFFFFFVFFRLKRYYLAGECGVAH